MAIIQTPQTPQTPPTSKVGQAFHALRAGLRLFIDEERGKLCSGDYDEMLLPYTWLQVDRLLKKLVVTGSLANLVSQVAVELNLDFRQEMYLWEGIHLVVFASLVEEASERAVSLGMAQADRIELMGDLCRASYRAFEWESNYLDTEVEKASFSTADPRSWL